ncbi:S1C family serine protease [Lutispora thermophila]|uniref:Serine protease Do n=1 Tax=Lutispora thermophila DSM 19022 TaxID=1122184 RepID=A0A1M6EFW0_9FIRM|nr:trypsin-like peptidase domain-containing protein [Lutispora thermophila]SHI84355.1 serine protease Do [Lutispora thermophila DSM 19022]
MDDDIRRDIIEDEAIESVPTGDTVIENATKEDIPVEDVAIKETPIENEATGRVDENMPMPTSTFYREVIEKKPKKWGKSAIAIALAIGLAFGSAFGFIADNIMDNMKGKNVVYASQDKQYNYTIDKTVSPVVPIAKKVSPSIVAIRIKKSMRDFFGYTYESEGNGSGIIIDSNGHIVTNNHVIDGSDNITVILHDGTELPAKVVGKDSQTDLAVIKVEGKNLQPAELGDSSTLEVGELAVAIGSPMGTDYAGSVTAGIISGLNRELYVGNRTMKLIQTDAAINPGNSGGALVNSEGKVIGINTLKLVENKVEGMGFAIPINEAKPIIEQLIQNRKVSRPYLGITGQTIDEKTAKQYDVPQGVLIRQVIEGSGADKAGLVRGDIITKVDGERITTIEQLQQIIQKHKVGDVVKVEAYGELNRYKTVEVKLTESDS